MKTIKKLLTASLFAIVSTAVSAQRSSGTFFAEYNPHQWDYTSSSAEDTNFHGVSVGFSYFVPVMGGLGFDAGLKGQYFFRREKENGIKYITNMFSATVPVDVVYDLKLGGSFAIDPFAGIYGRYNFNAKDIVETEGHRLTHNLFDKDQAKSDGYETLDHFQLGWQAGVNLRIGDMLTIGVAYWMDFNEIGKDTKLHGFNLKLGTNF